MGLGMNGKKRNGLKGENEIVDNELRGVYFLDKKACAISVRILL